MVAVVSPELAARRRQGEERLQRRDAPRVTASSRSIRTSARSSSSTAGSFTWTGRRAGRARRDRRLRHGRAAVRQAQHPRRDDHAERRAVHGRRQDPQEGPGQQLQRPRQQQDLRAVRGDGARPAAPGRRARRRCRTSSSRRSTWVVDELPRVLDARTGRIEDIDWPLEQNVRAVLARRHGFDPDDSEAIAMWDTSLQTLMFGRMIDHMKRVLHHRRHRDAGARRHRRDEHHAGRGEGADARDRRPQGARRHDAQHPAAVLPRRVLPDAAERRRGHAARARPLPAGQPGADAGALRRA